MTSSYIPKPIFDSLTSFTDNKNILLPRWISTCLPLTISLPELTADYTISTHFLYAYRGSAETFKSYRREVERLLQWSWFVANLSLQNIRREHIELYLEFCQSPPSHWIGTQHVPRFLVDENNHRIAHPAWRPFIKTVSKQAHREGQTANTKTFTLSQSALQSIFATLSSFFTYLEQENYVPSNPIAQIRQKSKFLRKHQTKKVIRRLSELQWIYVIETAEQLAAENPALHERTLFIMNALFGMYLRISELAASKRWTPMMGHFYRDMDENWWFKTVGKGNKERDISVSDAMLQALKRYRLHLNLPTLPSPGETIPLISKTIGSGPLEGTRHIRKIVQFCFDEAIKRLEQDTLHDEAEILGAATVHWLRHTGISEDVKTRPREHVRDDAGHSSSAITDQYIDVELRARHASAKKKLIKL